MKEVYKKCTGCLEVKTVGEFQIRNRERRLYESRCKACKAKYRREKYKQDGGVNKNTKRCPNCLVIRSLTQFYKKEENKTKHCKICVNTKFSSAPVLLEKEQSVKLLEQIKSFNMPSYQWDFSVVSNSGLS